MAQACQQTVTTEAAMLDSQHECSHSHHTSRCSTRVRIVANLEWAHGMCGGGEQSEEERAKNAKLAEISQPPTKG